jgi:hypothetical protein
MKAMILAVLVCVLALAAMPNAARAVLNVSIEVRDFSIGETAGFSYTILSDRNDDIVYTPSIRCIDAPQKMLEARALSLKAGVPVTSAYEDFLVTDEMVSQQCVAEVKTQEPFNLNAEKVFSINALASFSFDVKACKDAVCGKSGGIFIKGDDIYLGYESSIDSPSIESKLTFPDGSARQVSLPSSIKADQTGTYVLEATASKPGFKASSKSREFAVIEKPAVIRAASVCNANGACDYGENSQNCPQDCSQGAPGKSDQLPPEYLYAVIVVIAAVALLIFLRRRHKDQWSALENKYK